MKKTIALTVMTVCVAASMLLTGCSSKDEPAPAPDDSQITETPETTPETPEVMPETPAEPPEETPSGEAEGEAAKLIALMGKTDADVTAALGEGTKGENEGKLSYREYAMPVYGLDAITTVSYEEDAVSMIIAYANENKFDDWSAALTAELGEADENRTNNDEGSDTKEMTWTMDGGVMVALRDAYDTLSLEIFMGA